MFKKAVKHEAKLRLAIAGPSGGGKTYTALAIGTRLGSRVAVVDTEHGSASKYADLFEFDTLQLAAPFHPDRFTEAIKAAESAGYDVVIIDSLSHAWNGSGGALELVEQFSRKYKGNSYAAWGDVTPIQNRLIEAIVGANLHIIGTMRSKQDYILVEKNGKSMPQKVGMAPVQRDGFEYEFDVFLDMDIENNAIVSKTRCPALTGKVLPKPGNDVAAILTDWLKGVARPEQVSPPRQVEAPKPNGNGQLPTPDPAESMEGVPQILADVWAVVEQYDGLTLGIVAEIGAELPGYNHAQHTRNALAKNDIVEKRYTINGNGPDWAKGITPAGAKHLLRWLYERKQEAETE